MNDTPARSTAAIRQQASVASMERTVIALTAKMAGQAGGLATLPPEQRDQNIMALCNSAIVRLTEAKDVEKVIDLRNTAAAFAAYAKKLKAAMEAQNACQLVVLLAEHRIGAELKAAQERGEVATRTDNLKQGSEVRGADIGKATLSDLGIPRQRAAEYKQLAAAGEEAIKQEVATATAEDRPVSKKAIVSKREIRENEKATKAAKQIMAQQRRDAKWKRERAQEKAAKAERRQRLIPLANRISAALGNDLAEVVQIFRSFECIDDRSALLELLGERAAA
jgi:hypothetical protein